MKILIIRFSSIGDIVLTTPVVRCIKQQLPDCQVHYLTKSGSVELLLNNANIDKIITLDEKLRDTIAELKSEHYDYVVDLHNNHRSRLIRMALRAKTYVYRKENFHKWLTIITKHNFMSGRNVVDRYMQTLHPLGVVADGGGLQIFLSDDLSGDAFRQRVINNKKVAEITNRPYVVVACGAQHATKRIPDDKLLVLCSLIKSRVLLLGDKSDRKRLRDFGASFSKNVINLCGKTSLSESAALIRDAVAVITPDSSMMHFAAAFGRPVIAVWGATVPQFGFSAYATPHADCQVDGLLCRPCSRMGSKRCPLGHFKCMHQQSWQRIAEAANAIVEKNSAE